MILFQLLEKLFYYRIKRKKEEQTSLQRTFFLKKNFPHKLRRSKIFKTWSFVVLLLMKSLFFSSTRLKQAALISRFLKIVAHL